MKVPMLTERDKRFLHGLYKCVTMTTDQAREYYPKHYVYKRLRTLEKRGYVKRIVYLIQLTDKGVKLVTGKLEAPVRKTIKNKQNQHQIKLSEIYISLRQSGWDYLNSREVKKLYNLNRGERIDGMLVNGEEKYALYLMDTNPMQRTVLTIKKEITVNHCEKPNRELRNTIIFCTTPEAMKAFQGLEKLPGGALKIHLFPYPYGINILKKVAQPNALSILYTSVLGRHQLQPCNRPFADCLVEIDNQEFYVTELITNNLVRKYYLKKYAQDRAEIENRKVKLFILEGQLDRFSKDFAAYPHFQLITISDTWVNTLPLG